MSIKELREAIDEEKVLFGIKQAIKVGKKSKAVFICKDTRDEVVEKLESSGIEFVVLKSKEELTKELGLDFECEVFSIISKGKK
jgi:ribosomal protein L7Ae-like RNA K-turn-binding protein